mgnify:CR=1 FL=1
MIEKVFRIAQDLQYKEKCKAVRGKRKKNIGGYPVCSLLPSLSMKRKSRWPTSRRKT